MTTDKPAAAPPPLAPVDPDSEAGRRAAAALTRFVLDVRTRLARENPTDTKSA